MKLKIVFIGFLVLLTGACARAQTDTLLNRYRAFLFRGNIPTAAVARQWAGSLNANGQWPDIDYSDKEPAGWKIAQHLVRIRDMALSWACSTSANYHDQILFEKINAALDHWLVKRYKSSNWWHNQIGVPRNMRDIIILMRDHLTADRLQHALEVMAQLYVNDKATGGNLVWCADLGLHYGVLTGDTALVNRCRQLVIREIRLTTDEGIQPDYSFHQHGRRLQMYQYGAAFLKESVRLAWQLRGTPQQLPGETTQLLCDMVLKGWQWMARGIHTVPGTMDRSSSRKGELNSADLRDYIPLLADLQPGSTAALQQMAGIQNGEGALTGFRYYPYSDFTAYHRPGFSFFLKTISTRTDVTESINHENLKGKLLNSGDAYLIRNGREYTDLMPVWDWLKLPGVTAFKEAHHIDRQAFTGSVSDNVGSTGGITCMDYIMKDVSGREVLAAKKMWACFGDVVISLLSNIKTNNIPDSIYTALDQCRWQGDVTVNKPGNVLNAGVHSIKNVKWIHHNGFAYIPVQPAVFDVRTEEVTDSWTSINASETTQPVTEKVFCPVMYHQPGQGGTGYAMVYCETPGKAMAIVRKPSWKVLRNDEMMQAVAFKDTVTMIAFYAAGTLQINKRDHITVNRPCLVLLYPAVIMASDPSQKGGPVKITVNGETLSPDLPKDGTSTGAFHHVRLCGN